MITSMTGYGKGSSEKGKSTAEVEVKTVNSRYLDISLRLPSTLMNKESEIREFIKSKINRGKLSVIIQIKRNGTSDESTAIDKEKLKSYLSFIKEIKKTAKLTEKIKLEHILSNKEMFIAANGEYSQTEFELIKEALGKAIDNLIVMKKNEGSELTKDLKKRIQIIEEKLGIIEQEFKNSLQDYYTKLKERVSLLIEDGKVDEGRLEQELAFIAEKADITEECVRLHSHLKFFIDSIDNDPEPGRKLNFLCQEMNRETNTISSKSISTVIIHNTVRMKEEIEKIREQIQNVE